MKKFLLSLLCAVATIGAYAAETASIDVTFSKDTWNPTQSYISTITSKDGNWQTTNFNNNNFANDWAYVKCGPKGATNNVATLSSLKPLSEAISSVDVTVDAVANGSINSISVCVSNDDTFDANDATFSATLPADYSNGAVVNIPITDPAANKYYRVYVTTTNTTSNKNGVATISKFAFNYNNSGETPVEPSTELGDVVATYEGTAIEADGDVSVEEGTVFSISAANATEVTISSDSFESVVFTEFPALWTPAVMAEDIVTITATDGTATKELTFLLTVTEKQTVVDPTPGPEPTTSTTYVKVTSADQLKDGNQYIIVGTPAKVNKIQYGPTVMTQAKKNGKGFDGTYLGKEDATELADSYDIASIQNVSVITLKAATEEGKWYLMVGSQYLQAGAEKKLTLGDSAYAVTITTSETNSKITFGTYGDLNANYANVSGGDRGSITFNNYTSNQKPVFLYVQKSEDSTSIAEVEAVEGNVEWFDLQGRRVAEPAHGIFIRRCGNTVTKVRR